MQDRFTYRRGARLPGVELGPWTDRDGDAIDLTAYTCTLTLLSHITGGTITPAATVSGSALGYVTITWAANDLDRNAGHYTLQVSAEEIATGKQRDYAPLAPPLLLIVGGDVTVEEDGDTVLDGGDI